MPLAEFTPLESPLKLDGKNNQKRRERKAPLFLTGFTLIETIMVIVIIGIMAAVAIPRFNAFYGIKLGGVSKKVVSDIRYVQRLAVSRHQSYNLNFSTNPTNRYTVTVAAGGGYAKDPFSRQDFIVNFNTDPHYGGIRIAATTFGGGILQFDWQGIPCNSAGLPLAADNSLTLSYQGNNKTIVVTQDTGRVVIQ